MNLTKLLPSKAVSWLISQAMSPRGLYGHVLGLQFAFRPSNRKRNIWAVSVMDVQPSDQVLEIGFGPGVAIKELARRATAGQVFGIDRSEVMRLHASWRNAKAIRSGRVSLRTASIDELPVFETQFDKILAVNTIGGWSDPIRRLTELRQKLRVGGEIAIVLQPRMPGANAETTAAGATRITEMLEAAGFVDMRLENLPLKPPVACVIGTRSEFR